jgi:hypothetical protein
VSLIYISQQLLLGDQIKHDIRRAEYVAQMSQQKQFYSKIKQAGQHADIDPQQNNNIRRVSGEI